MRRGPLGPKVRECDVNNGDRITEGGSIEINVQSVTRDGRLKENFIHRCT